MIKKWLVRFLVLIVALFGGYKLWQTVKNPGTNSGTNVLTVKDNDWTKGDANAKVTIIEYADFECPACAIYSTDILKKLVDEYKSDLRVVYRNFPLPQHKKALEAAKSAEAAGKQGKFWEMHDLLYEKQSDWSGSGDYKNMLSEYAKSLGIDMTKYEEDFKSDSVLSKIKQDENDGYALRINSTPTFYINGKKVEIVNGYEDLKREIDNQLGRN